LEILKSGGNAVDAAIAVNAALGLMEPTSCGIGGDLYALVWDAKAGKLHGLNASGRAPAAATRDFFLKRGDATIPLYGPLSISVPGCVDGWLVLHERFGKLPLARVLAPAIAYAEAGVPVPDVIAGYWRASEWLLRQRQPAAAIFLPGGRAPRPGELFANPALAKAYRLIAERGRAGFYTGDVAAKIVATVKAEGGLLELADLEQHTSTWVEPIGTNYRGYDVWQIPPPGQGLAVLQMLNLLEGYDLAKWGPRSADYWHTFIEAKKLAYADRARYYADQAFVQVPVAELASKQYAARRRKLIQFDQVLQNVPSGDPRLGQSDTAYLCVVDRERNCVSLIQSNYTGFGSGLVVSEYGFGLQNRGALFALGADHPNRLEPRKRPFHTIIPGLVTQGGRPRFVFGVMGGDMQPQGQVQVLVNMIDFRMNVQAAGDAPRMEHVGSASPTGSKEQPPGGLVRLEGGFSDDLLRDLEKRGHRLERVRVNGGGYQGIWISPETEVLSGGSESRKDGAAVGY
jgi:gamma-glutamyltranspeptidase/glutathione hydrolase